MKTLRVLLPAALLCATRSPRKPARPPSMRTVTAQEPDSIRGDYHIGFAPLDRNHDSFISHAQTKANPTLECEFDALEALHTGRRSKA